MPPQEGLPDLVFTANCAAVFDGTVLLSRFRHAERRGEEPHGADTFERLGELGLVERITTPGDGEHFEGAGDCIWDPVRGMFWAGWGPRSSAGAPALIERTFGRPAVALELVDPRFYHLDTCFAVLPRGEVLHYPPAFSATSLAAIHANVAPEQRIEASAHDALTLAVNAFSFGENVVMGDCSAELRAMLTNLGYRVHVTPLGSFNLSGGAAYCLTLRLDLGERDAQSTDVDTSLAA
jgi:N-dimethylarginine dimethylaminohydrolase